MSHEEKILHILEAMQGDISKLKSGQTKLEQGQAQTNDRLGKLEAGQARLQSDVSAMQSDVSFVKKTAMKLEQDHGTKLRAISEELDIINGKLDDHTDRLEKMWREVSRHDLRIGVHDTEIKRLKAK